MPFQSALESIGDFLFSPSREQDLNDVKMIKQAITEDPRRYKELKPYLQRVSKRLSLPFDKMLEPSESALYRAEQLGKTFGPPTTTNKPEPIVGSLVAEMPTRIGPRERLSALSEEQKALLLPELFDRLLQGRQVATGEMQARTGTRNADINQLKLDELVREFNKMYPIEERKVGASEMGARASGMSAEASIIAALANAKKGQFGQTTLISIIGRLMDTLDYTPEEAVNTATAILSNLNKGELSPFPTQPSMAGGGAPGGVGVSAGGYATGGGLPTTAARLKELRAQAAADLGRGQLNISKERLGILAGAREESKRANLAREQDRTIRLLTDASDSLTKWKELKKPERYRLSRQFLFTAFILAASGRLSELPVNISFIPIFDIKGRRIALVGPSDLARPEYIADLLRKASGKTIDESIIERGLEKLGE